MILRLDDTDVERNTQASVDSIFDGLKWLGLGWDEEYKQSERVDLHRKTAWTIFEKGLAYRDFTPAHSGDAEKSGAQGTRLFNPGARELSGAESDRRAAAGEPFALRFRVPRENGQPVRFTDAVYGEQEKSAADIEDFALLRSDGMTTYHLASCADDAALRITHIIRGQDQAFQAPPRSGRERHHLPRRRISSGGVHQLPLPARLVAKKRPREYVARGTHGRFFARRHQPLERGGELQRAGRNSRRQVRSESGVAQRRTDPRPARRRPERPPAANRARRRIQHPARKNAAHHAVDPRAHQTAPRSAHGCRLLLR